MATNTDTPLADTVAPGSTPVPPATSNKVKASSVAVSLNEQPMRGGSYTRNADGSLTQTEGHGFADDQPTQE